MDVDSASERELAAGTTHPQNSVDSVLYVYGRGAGVYFGAWVMIPNQGIFNDA